MQATEITRPFHRPHPDPEVLPEDRNFLQELMAASLVLLEDWEALPMPAQEELIRCQEPDQTLALLVEHGLLTEYQAARISAGKTEGLVLGNYRILDRLGAGGMGVVFKGEHLDLRRLVAIKVWPQTPEQDPHLLPRFLAEIRTVAQLHHPNIVAAIDAGKASSRDPDGPILRYFVMEYVPGQDLEEYILTRGPLLPAKACDLIHQVAGALAETHKYHLVHRDIKPSNVLITPEDQAKLLDFGLAQQRRHRLSEQGLLLGTLDYMAPEQARDASRVDIRADLYGLGGVLFWCLTGQVPFPEQGTMAEDITRRRTQPPPSVRAQRPDLPAELDALVARLMAIQPDDRYPTPEAVMRALLPFLKQESREDILLGENRIPVRFGAGPSSSRIKPPLSHRVLLVDDEAAIRGFTRQVLQAEGIQCDEAANGLLALEAVSQQPYDLILTDIHMPGLTGLDLLRQLRERPPVPNLKIVMVSGRSSSDEMAKMLGAGADDYLTKPFSVVQLQGRVKAALRLKEAQDRSELLNQQLLTVNAELEATLSARDSDLVQARNALVLALAKLVEHRDTETGAHLVRLQRYCRCLAEEAARLPNFAGQIDHPFIEMLECCVPLHDIGKVGLPDHILLKPGRLTSDERILMQAHTLMGADTLKQVARQHNFALAFLQTAIDIVRHHHERWDGTGYPDGLTGNAIPLAARIVTVADVYDALRSRRVYKPALSHTASVHLILEASPGQFDPALVPVFQRCAAAFERIFQEMAD